MRTLASMDLNPIGPALDQAVNGEAPHLSFGPSRVKARGGVSLALVRGPQILSGGGLSERVIELDSELPLKEAARRMVDDRAERAVVLAGGRRIGTTSLEDILEEMSVSRDPLTGLPWSDRLRDWGVQRLQAGQEITIIFLDLDNFGRYNKQHGHIVGDRVLQSLARTVSPLVDHSRGVFVRYGGDEFVIGTVAGRPEAERLAERLKNISIILDEIEEEVTFSMGLAGGKRTNERISINWHATLDNLINMASVDAIRSKALRDTTYTRGSALILRRFLGNHPDLAPLLHDIVYELEDSRGLVVRLMSEEGQVLGSAPLAGESALSLQAALQDWASRASA